MKGSRRANPPAPWLEGGYVDVGNDPPLLAGDKTDDRPVRRAVSIRWLTGTILTGFISIFLMGGALMAALDGRHLLAIAPEVQALFGIGTEAISANGKGDRIRPVEVEVATRQVLQVSTVSRQGDRDFIKLRPFVRISASLTKRNEQFASKVPAYDPLKIFADGTIEDSAAAAAPADQIYGADVDGEVSVKTAAMPAFDTGFDRNFDFKTADVQQIVHDAVRPVGSEPDPAVATYADAKITVIDPTKDVSAGGVSITTQNVTMLAKNGTAGNTARSDRMMVLAPRQSLRDTLLRNDIGADDAASIVASLSSQVDLARLPAGQRLRIGYAPSDVDGGTVRAVRVSLYDGANHQATVARSDNDSFVRAGAPAALAEAAVASVQDYDGNSSMPRLYEAIYQTALAQQMPDNLIRDLIKVLSYEVDYQTQISPGDAIEVFHPLPDPDASADEGILYASITLGGVKKRFYRFRTPDDGIIDYYDADGRSAKKFLMRKPMTVGHYASGFGYRRHPVLGYTRLHAGVDWSAPRGTPIMASGNGIIEKVGPTSGYGNYVQIRHTNGYETGYGHMSAFAKGLQPGMRVRQGQIVGYVGSTGLSTGNHLHYEVRVNGKVVDPLRIRLPRGRVLQGDLLNSFERERARIDEFLTHPGNTGNQKVAALQ